MSKSKVKSAYLCSSCGDQFAKWNGQCPSCNEWGTLAEYKVNVKSRSKSNGKVNTPSNLVDVLKNGIVKSQETGIREVDRVLGGGILPGSMILLGGNPGIGKSTLALQIIPALKYNVLYVSAEESEEQLALRARRLKISTNDIKLSTENNIELIFGIGGGKTQSSSHLTENLLSLMNDEAAIKSKIKIKKITQKPWGSYQVLHQQEEFLVKKLIINSGEEISNQFHEHRHEHWVLVSGTIEVILEDKKFKMLSNDHIYIPKGSRHQIINPFAEPAEIIEIQSGRIISEDDIVRISDKYKRNSS